MSDTQSDTENVGVNTLDKIEPPNFKTDLISILFGAVDR